MERRNLWHIIRDFMFSKTNREFLIFLFFLALAGLFWLFLALNETYEKEFAIPVTVTDVPKNMKVVNLLEVLGDMAKEEEADDERIRYRAERSD